MQHIFISRPLAEQSEFYTSLAGQTVEQKHIIFAFSLIDFAPIEFDRLPACDWIFFYSKTGVDFFFKNIHQKNILLPNAIKWAAFGEATAKSLIPHSFSADFIGTGSAISTVSLFSELAIHQKVLFPQAQFSRNSVALLLKNTENIPLVVYKNTAATDFVLPFCHVLVFTSPLNVIAYFQKYTFQSTQKFIAIGDTTAETLAIYVPKQNRMVSETASEKSLAQAVLSFK
jgi:hydroxymethylbilane synthase